MKLVVFSARRYDREMLEAANARHGHDITFHEARLTRETAALAEGFPAASVFVNDQLDAAVLEALAAGGTGLLATRSTGFNQIDLPAAARFGVKVTRVAEYSPHSVAEFATGLLLSLNRRIHRAYDRTRNGNFELDGLMGFDLKGRTIGIIGTGKIGLVFARIMAGFGCTLLAHDPFPQPGFQALGGRYVTRETLAAESDVISLHCPLTPETRHIVDAAFLARTRPGLLLINTSRGALLDTRAAIGALKSRHLGGLAIDVYEQEENLFFQDRSDDIIDDDVMQRLITFPNTLVTGHQAFFTREAFETICETTLASVSAFARGEALVNEVRV